MTLTLDDCRSLRDQFDTDWREIARHVQEGDNDFTLNLHGGEFRFIRDDDIDEILADELASDLYMVGCFTPSALSDATGISPEVFEHLQAAKAYEAIGKLVEDLDCIGDLADTMVSDDGYGHHFNHCDGGEETILLDEGDFYVFRVN